MIVIIDYGIGNVASVLNMFKKIGVKDVVVSNNKDIIAKGSKIVLPGVGAFDAGMNNLEHSELIPLLNQKALVEKVPFLGICLGMQLLTKQSEEGVKKGLGWINAETVKFNFDITSDIKIPHMGWNFITPKKDHILMQSLPENPRYYFVHSYYVKCDIQTDVLATCNYGFDFTCAVQRDNIMGVQFHPEKSHIYGFQLLKNFSEL